MAFGPELLVVRNAPVEGKANQVRLGKFVPDRFPVLPRNDPATPFIEPGLAGILMSREDMGWYFKRRIADEERIIWGIIDDEQPVGFGMLSLDEVSNLCAYTIVLHPIARNRGLGSLATVGFVKTGLMKSTLHNVSEAFDRTMFAISTSIHPGNVMSRRMCERAGFVLVENEYHEIGGVDFLSYACERPAERPDLTIIPV